MFQRLARYPQEREKQSYSHWDDYAILKTEVIVRPRGYFYIGGAASQNNDREGRGLPENLFGATVGLDLTRWLANRQDDRWTSALNAFGRTSVTYTHWFE
jgi:hypothetical protein